MTKLAHWARPGRTVLSAAITAVLITSCTSGSDSSSSSPSATQSASPSASRSPGGQKTPAERNKRDDPSLFRGFRSWLKTNDTRRDDDLGQHVLALQLSYDDGRPAGTVDVLTDYGPWASAEKEVPPLADAFRTWWDSDPSADTARFRSQGGKTVKKVKLHSSGKPTNLLTEFRSWVAGHAENGKSRAKHITSLSIGYGKRGTGAVTVSTDYLAYKDSGTQRHIDALARDFLAWWDGDDGADSVTVTSGDQGIHAERKLTTR